MKLLDARQPGEIRVDQLLRLVTRDPEVFGEPERRDPVDDPEVDHLRRVALIRVSSPVPDAEHLDGGRGWMSSLRGERLAQHRFAGDVGEDAQLDLRVVGREQPRPSAATNAERIRAELVRIGIDCRFGFVVESRPVAATAWLIVVWRRPSLPISSGNGRRYVLRSFVSSRHSSSERGRGGGRRGSPAARARRSSTPSCPSGPAVSSSFSKRIRASCCVEPSWNSSPACSYACASSSSTRSLRRAVISPMR